MILFANEENIVRSLVVFARVAVILFAGASIPKANDAFPLIPDFPPLFRIFHSLQKIFQLFSKNLFFIHQIFDDFF